MSDIHAVERYGSLTSWPPKNSFSPFSHVIHQRLSSSLYHSNRSALRKGPLTLPITAWLDRPACSSSPPITLLQLVPVPPIVQRSSLSVDQSVSPKSTVHVPTGCRYIESPRTDGANNGGPSPPKYTADGDADRRGQLTLIAAFNNRDVLERCTWMLFSAQQFSRIAGIGNARFLTR